MTDLPTHRKHPLQSSTTTLSLPISINSQQGKSIGVFIAASRYVNATFCFGLRGIGWQGILVSNDFDIRKEAGAFLQALRKEYMAQVSENYLEIHLFWAGKGTCCIPAPDTYGPAISAMSATPDFKPSVSNNPPTGVSNSSSTGKKNRTRLIVGISGGGVLILVMLVFYLQRRKRPNSCDDEGQSMHNRRY